MRNSIANLRNVILNEAAALKGMPYIRHVDKHTIKTDKDEYIRVFELKGRTFQTQDITEINNWHESRNRFLYGIADSRVALWTYIIREEDSHYPENKFINTFTQAMDQKYKKRLETRKMFSNRIFVSLVLKSVDSKLEKAAGVFNLFSKKIDKKYEAMVQQEDMETMSIMTDEVMASLKSYGIRQLSTYETDLGLFSEPMEFLARIYNGYWQKMPLRYQDIRNTLATERPLFGKEVVEIRRTEDSLVGGFLGIKEYAEITKPGVLDNLFELPFSFTLTQSFTFIPKHEAEKLMVRQHDRMIQMEDLGGSQILAIKDGLDDLVSGRIVMGKHHLSLCHFHKNIRDANRNLAEAGDKLKDAGFVVARESIGAEPAFWAQFPANHKEIPRASLITSRNFSGFNSFHNYPTGSKDNNHWGEAVFKAKTDVGTPYYFNFHVGDVGLTAIYGMTGSGKTVAMNFFMAQSEKFNPQVVFFDKDRGAEIFIRASRGNYNTIRVGEPTGFNPLHLESTPLNHTFIRAWLKELVTSIDKQFSITDSNEIDFAVNALFAAHVPIDERRLSYLAQFFQNVDDGSVRHRLTPWISGGEFDWVFDNPNDTLSLDNRVLGFDMTEFLDSPTIRTPILMYLMHRVDSLINGQRFQLYIDEGWKALDDDYFEIYFKNWLKVIRKKNGMVVFGTQSPQDAIKSKIASTLLEQTATTILTPNPKAKRSDYVDHLGLTDTQFELLRGHDLQSHKLLIKQGDDAVVVQLDLAGMDEELAVLSGTSANVNLLDSIRADVGDDPDDWMPLFLEQRKSG
jgi:type IV secretion system protein VirB4